MNAQAPGAVAARSRAQMTITLPDAGRGRPAALASPDIYRALMARATLPFALVDAGGGIDEANRAFASLLGTTIGRLAELRLDQVTHPADVELLESVRQALLSGEGQADSCYLRFVTRSGETVQALAHLSVAEGADGVRHVLLAAVDLRGHRDRLNSLAHAATHDPLTGLLNRAGLMAQLQTLLHEGRSVSVALLDLDRLKPINDAYGHAVGDDLLRSIATALHKMASPDGLACRLAGDEFVVIADTTDEVALGRYLTDELDRMEVEIAPGVVVTPTASVGTASVRTGMTPSQILALADDSMYAVKRRRQEALSAS